MSQPTGLTFFGGGGLGRKTATADTVIRHVVPALRNAIARIMKLVYTAAGTAHTVTVMRPIASATTLAADCAGTATITLTASLDATSNALAANDIVVLRRKDTDFHHLGIVSSVSSLTVVLTAALPTTFEAGSDIWNFGIPGDTNPYPGDNAAHPGFTGTASATTTYSNDQVGIVAAFSKNEPLVVSSNNATAAGVIEQVSYAHTIR